MLKFILRRLVMMIPVMFGVLFITFVLNYINPACPARGILGEQALPEAVEELRERMGLDDPFIVQFFSYVGRTVLGDAEQTRLGRSFQSRRPVWDEISDRFPTTFRLAAMGAMVAVVIGIPLGIISATKQYTIFDNIAQSIGLIGVSIPNFALGMMLILFFSVRLEVFPPSGFETPIQWIMPSLTIGMSSAAIVMRMTRSSMLEVIRQDYIRTARAKGQKESVIIFRHALKNALIPVITVVGLQFGFLLGGAAITETIFSIAGLGGFMINSIRSQDFPIVQGGVLLIAIIFSMVNLLVDILYAYVDPRIRSQYK